MLRRDRRVTSGRDYKAIFAGGKSYPSKLAILRVLPKRGDQPSRFGFLTSSKMGKAVVRNRAKRLLREAVRLLEGNLQPTGYDAALIARPPIKNASFAEVSKTVEELFRSAGRLRTYKESTEGNQQD